MANQNKELLVLCGLEHKEDIVPKKQKSEKNDYYFISASLIWDYQFIGFDTSFRSCKPNH